jgi:hypothetical protein
MVELKEAVIYTHKGWHFISTDRPLCGTQEHQAFQDKHHLQVVPEMLFVQNYLHICYPAKKFDFQITAADMLKLCVFST